VPLGLLGALAGAIFMIAFKQLRQIMQPLKTHLIVRGFIGGLGLGLAGALLPLTLFSGEEQTAILIKDAAALGVVMLIVLALVKLLITTLCLATGWKGGYIFPTMFAGTALGLAAHLIFPSIPVAVAVAATMGGAMVATMKAPIFSALFVMVLVQREASPVIAIAVIVGALATARISMTSNKAE
jgi:H+/Cl- antiporter ClcA